MSEPDKSLTILIPCFNDWESVGLLVPMIDRALSGAGWNVSVMVVDDASTDSVPESWLTGSFTTVESIEILRLRANLGHQRAIALGLYQVHEFTDADAVLVMDGDGEDRPEDLPVILTEFSAGGGGAMCFSRPEENAWRALPSSFAIAPIVSSTDC